MAERNIQKTITPYIKSILDNKAKEIVNPIYVFVGIEQYVNMDVFAHHIADKETFFKNGNKSVFTDSWFAEVFTKLTMALSNPELEYTILSFAQFSYLISNINPDFFKTRLVIVQDGFRALLPLSPKDFLEKAEVENIEERSEDMPIYMAEQMQIGKNYYYSAKMPVEVFTTLNVFSEKKTLQLLSYDNKHEVIDTATDPYGLDTFLNKCLNEDNFNKNIIVKVFKKQPMNQHEKIKLEKVNWLLSLFGGQLYELDEKAVDEKFTPSEETKNLLKKYWGKNASFRELRVYKDPNYGKDIVSISQGLIVETIINEYKNAKEGKEVKDLFLTAPHWRWKISTFPIASILCITKSRCNNSCFTAHRFDEGSSRTDPSRTRI